MAAGDFQLPVLSFSTSGRPIAVAATASAGTQIHTAQSGSTGVDVVTIYATNIDTVARTLTIQWGGTGTSDQLGPITIGANRGAVLVADRQFLQGGLTIRAYADVANVINLTGGVSRYTSTA